MVVCSSISTQNYIPEQTPKSALNATVYAVAKQIRTPSLERRATDLPTADMQHAIRLARNLRNAQFATEIVSAGSPRKRFDKAAKMPSYTLISLSVSADGPTMRIRGEGSDIAARVEALVAGSK